MTGPLLFAYALLTAVQVGLLWSIRPVREAVVNALARVGLVRVRADGTVAWPVSVSPWWIWAVHLRCLPWERDFGWFGVFRNKPGVVRDVPGRWLPARWGFRVLGLEVGDRGGHPRLLVLRRGRAEEARVRLRLRGRTAWARYYPGLSSWYVWDEGREDRQRFGRGATLDGAVRSFEDASQPRDRT